MWIAAIKGYLLGIIVILYVAWILWREHNGITYAPWNWRA